MAPTRELAEQVAKSIAVFSRYKGLNIVSIYGGVSIEPQIRQLERADIVVGTPGRILDHLQRRTLDLRKINTVVLDEADRMLDMGFIDDVQKILERCPENKQTLLFSATISADIERIAKRYQKNPILVSAETYVDASKLKQVYYDTPRNLRFSLLVHLLKQEHSGLIMIFCNTRNNADFLANNLSRYDIEAMAIHGGLSQNRRNSIMEQFNKNHFLILICTDVAARGLGIKNVSHVYNYDVPKTSTEYVHRIGRTARAGKEGIAITIVSDRDYENFRNVLQDDSLKIEKQELPELQEIKVNFAGQFNSMRRGRSSGGYRGRSGYGGGHGGGHRGGGRSYSRGDRDGDGGRDRGDRGHRSGGRGFSRGRSSGHRGGSSFGRSRRY
jgi:ATP-dependent RNA helicase DeaD